MEIVDRVYGKPLDGHFCFGEHSVADHMIKEIAEDGERMDFLRRSLKNASVLTRAELEKRIGMDVIESMKGLGAEGQNYLEKRIEDNVVLFLRSTNTDVVKFSNEDLLKSPMGVDAFRAVTVSWLLNVSLFLSFGEVRHEAIRDAWNLRNKLKLLSFEDIRGILRNNIAAISAQMKRHAVVDIIDRIENVIDREAIGSLSVVVDKGLYKHKIELCLQQYWKKVKEAFRMSQENVDIRLDAISKKYGDFSTGHASIKNDICNDGIISTEDVLLERDLAQLEYFALQRYGALSEKELGEVSDKVTEVAQDITLARRRIEGGLTLRMMTWSRWKLFERMRSEVWGAILDDVLLKVEYGSYMAVLQSVGAKMSADLIDFYNDGMLANSLRTIVVITALKNSGFEEVSGALEKAYRTVDVVFSRDRWKIEGQRLLWQLIRGYGNCSSTILDFAYEKVVSSLEQSEELKRNRVTLQKKAEQKTKFSYLLGRLVWKLCKWFRRDWPEECSCRDEV